MKVYIDPGHGGVDSGAVGNGLLEKDLNLDISLKQKNLFERLGHVVRMSRAVDKVVSLEARANDANSWGADVFISNHINAGGGTGVEVWHSILGGKSKEYASSVEESLRKVLTSRGLKTREGRNGDYLFVIRETNMPAILIEFGFIDNAVDTEKLKREEIRQRLAEAVVSGILGVEVDSSPPPPVREENPNPVMRVIKYKSPMMSGDDVKQIQRILNNLGYNAGYVDGIYGLQTEGAVRRFQKDNSLVVDGIVGPNTWSKLINLNNTPKLNRLLIYTSPMLIGEDVRLIQDKLNSLGYKAGAEDGIYGRNTEEAVKRFQRAKGLLVDGIVGEKTWAKLMQ